MPDRKTIIGATAGVAAAAAAGIAAARRSGSKTTAFEVKPDDGEWLVEANGKAVGARHRTKKVAVAAGRKAAHAKAPSTLTIRREDGTIAREHAYEA